MAKPTLRKIRGFFYIRERNPGQKEKITSTRTRSRKEAEIALERYNQEREARENGYQGDYSGMSPTLRQTSDLFLEDCTRNGLRQETLRSYTFSLDNFSRVFPYSLQVSYLSNEVIRQFTDHLKHSGIKGKRAATSVNVNLRSVRVFLNWLYERRFISHKIKIKQIKVNQKKLKILTPDELKKIYNLIDDQKLLATFRVYEHTGMRLGELHTCEKEGKYIRIIAETAKGRSERIVPLPDEIRDDFELATTNPYLPNRITKQFTKYRKLACVAEGKSLHSLRHTFAARTLISQKNPYLVKTLLGHKSITTTEIYLQFPEGYLKDILSESTPTTEIVALA